MWRLKTRAMWLEARDNTTSFSISMHLIGNFLTPYGIFLLPKLIATYTKKNIQNSTVSYFISLYKVLDRDNIGDQLKVLKHYPTLFSREEGALLEVKDL